MRQLAFEQEVNGRLLGRPHLIPVFTNALRIPERLREANPAYFVTLNVVRVLEKIQGRPYQEWTAVPPGVTPRWNAWYEVHKLNVPPWVGGLALPFGPLDARAVQYVMERDTELVGDSIWRRLEAEERRVAEEKARQRRRIIEDIALDLRPALENLSWGPGTFGPWGPS